jgi:hypothetical protein
MVEQTFSISSAWSIDPPCYVRKVDRSGHCKDAATIRDKAFCLDPDDSTISVYLVASATDLARVAIALNANRSSKTEPLFLLAITAAELAKIAVRQSPGLTLCMWANHLHRNLLVPDVTQVARLAETLVAVGRKQHKFTEKAIQEALAATTYDGCHAADPTSADCACEDELPKSRPAKGLRPADSVAVQPAIEPPFWQAASRCSGVPYLFWQPWLLAADARQRRTVFLPAASPFVINSYG